MNNDGSDPQIRSFETDKSDFLDQIRKFNPNPESEKE